jgi:hypothetical protein
MRRRPRGASPPSSGSGPSRPSSSPSSSPHGGTGGEAVVGVLVLVLIGSRRARIREVQRKRRREEVERYAAEKAVREAARLERAARRRGGR